MLRIASMCLMPNAPCPATQIFMSPRLGSPDGDTESCYFASLVCNEAAGQVGQASRGGRGGEGGPFFSYLTYLTYPTHLTSCPTSIAAARGRSAPPDTGGPTPPPRCTA